MVSVVSGSGLGVVNTSRNVVGGSGELGQAGQGRAGERVTVNAANGNLVIQNQDGLLMGVGADVGLLRTYNSQGGWDGDNGDAWRLGYYRRVGGLTGTLNAADSTLTRTDADGFESTYTYRDGRYVSTDGAGVYDSLTVAAGEVTWTDGDTGQTETYAEATPGQYRLTRITDPEGHALQVTYDAQGLIASLSTWRARAAVADETLTLVYDGRRLTQVDTRTQDADGSLRSQTRVYYTYDAAGRLASVVTDLSPEDRSTVDGRTYSVNYSYDNAGRVRTLTQTDGSALTVDYDEDGRVRQVTDALGHATTFAYDTAARQTTVTDALNQVARLAYDNAGRLSELSGSGFKTSFAYDADGNLLASTNGLGQQTLFSYDDRGNLIRSTDATGRVQESSFDAANRRTGLTQYTQPGVAQTTRYVYDSTGGLRRLRFSVSAEGRVTEQQYNSLGQVTRSLAYTRSPYSGAATLADLGTWAAQQSGAQQTDYRYDLRGQLASRTDAAGLTRYTYDPFGRLLQTIDANGRTTAYAYDGLDRLLLSTDALGNNTVTSYDDAGYRTSVLAANGLRSVSTYNAAGLLVAQTQFSGSTALGQTRYVYDADNRLRMTQDPTGQRQWMLYDDAGRKVGDVDALGHLTETRYDAAGRLVQTVGYEQPVNTALLLDAQGQPANLSVATLRPVPSTQDRRQWQLFDAAGRLTHQINSLGEVTETQYDGAGRLSTVIQHGQRLATLPATQTSSGSSDPPVLTYAATGDPDRITRTFYDADGLQRGTLDAEGYFTEMRYDAAGRLVERIAYATTSTPTRLIPTATSADRHSVWLYDTQGRPVAEIDPDGWLTEITYNTAGQRAQRLRYARRISGTATPASTLADLRPASSPQDQSTNWTYDALNRVQTETADGTVTRYTYDPVGNLISTDRAWGTAEVRSLSARYDLQGRLIAELSAEGTARLAQAGTPAQIDAVWNSYATQHAYDAAGRRIRSTDTRGSSTLYYFDAAGRLSYTVLQTERGGEVQASRSNGFGETVTQIHYTRRLSAQDTAALTGGQTDAALDAKIAALADAADQRTQAIYNQRGQIQQAIDALGFKTSSRYDAFGQLSRSEAETGDGRVLRTDYAHDRRGLLTATIQDPLGLQVQTRTEYDAFGRITARVDARGYRSSTEYLASDGRPDSGRQVVLTDALGARSSSTYDAFERVIRQTDALGHSVSFSHDTANRRVTMTSAEGLVTVTESTRHGQVATLTDGTGASTTYRYDQNGNLLSRTDALGHVTQNTYDAADNLLTQTEAGTLTRYTYDAAQRVLTRQVDPDGLNLRTTYAYDGQGRTVQVTDAAATLTSYRFDAQGQLTETVVDDSATGLKLRTSTSYDAQGHSLSVTEGAGTAAARTTQYRYDALGRRTQETVDPTGLQLTTQYEYDATGNLVLKRNALGTVTRYGYDALGRKTSETVDPNGLNTGLNLSTQYAYDGAGNLAQVTDPAGQITRHLYDADHRLRYTLDAEYGLSETVYDAAGRIVQTIRYAEAQQGIDTLVQNNGTVAHRFKWIARSPARDRVTRYAYDAVGHQTLSVDALGAVTESQYDAAGRITRTTQYARPIPLLADGSNDQATVALSGDYGYVTGANFAAIDTGKTYLVRVRLRQLSGTGTLYAGVVSRDSEGRTLANAYSGTYAYAAAPGVTLTPEMGWVSYEGLITGENPLDAAASRHKFFAGSKSATPLLLYNYYGSNADPGRLVEIDSLELIDVATGTVLNTSADMSAGAASLTVNNGAVVGASANTEAPLSDQDIRARLRPDAATDRVTRYAYDAAGRQTLSVNALGAVTESQYDAAGRITRTTQYARPIPLPAEGASDPHTVSLSGDYGYVTGANFAAIDTSKTYKVRVRLRQLSGTGTVYAGVVTRDSEGRTLANAYSGTYVYAAAPGITLTPEMGWVSYEGLITGENPLDAAASAHKFFAGSKSATPLLLYNYGASNTDPGRLIEVDSLELIDVSTGAVLNPSADMSAGAASLTVNNGAVVGADARLSAQDIQARLRPDATNDRVTRYVYDAAGRQTHSVNAVGSVTQFEYDAVGRVIAKHELANQMPAGAALKLKNNGSQGRTIAKTLGTFKAGDVVTATLRFKAPASLEGQLFLGDSGGADPYDNAVSSAVAGNGGWQTLTLTRTMSHDDMMRVVLYNHIGSPDPDAGVVYDDLRVTSRLQGPVLVENFEGFDPALKGWDVGALYEQTQNNPAQVGTQDQLAAFLPTLRDADRDRITRTVYDAAGRPIYTQDALGYLSRTRYNAAGQPIEQIRYATPISSTTPPTQAAFDAALVTDAAFDRPTRHVYDRAGQLRFSVDALGGVVETLYDAQGQVARRIAYDTAIPYTRISDTSSPEALRALLPTSTLGARETIYTHDRVGRLVHTAQALSNSGSVKTFSVSENQYDPLGQLIRSVAYSTPQALQDLPTLASPQALAERLSPLADASLDRSTRNTYDAAGRLVQRTDGEGYSEQSVYDPWGHKTRFINKNGAVFDYEYDRLGRLRTEWSPAVDITRLDEALNPVVEAGQRIQTRLRYDAWGQLLSRTEAYGRPEARTTGYDYDALGRQVRTRFEPVAIYNAAADDLGSNGLSGTPVRRTEIQRSLVTETVYDAFGQAVVQRDAAGAYSYKTYDPLGRLRHEVDANHHVTQHQYSLRDGEYTEVTRLGAAAVFTDTLSGDPASMDAAVATAAAAGGARHLRTVLDRLGRTQRVEDLLDGVYSQDGSSGQGGQWVRATRYDYTVWGDLQAKSTLLDPTSPAPRSATTWFAYTLQGGLSRQVDAEGYVTESFKNAFGEDERITQYAARLDLATQSPWAAITSTLASTQPDSAIGHDRTRLLRYDRRGLQQSQQQQDVQVGVQVDPQHAEWRLAQVTTQYQHDGVGNVLSVQDSAYDRRSGARLPSPAETLNFYDALGRLTASVQAGRTTRLQHDALGHTVLSTRHANLALLSLISLSAERGITLGLPTASPDDQITRQQFDALGRVLRCRDAMGGEQFFSYDAAGRVAKQWRPFATADGQALNAVQVFAYDRLGQQTETRTLLQREAGAAATYSSEQVQYNPFGEITARLRDEDIADGVAAQQVAYYDYDQGGRLWRTNAGEGTDSGVDTVYLYNLQDKVSAVITSPTLDLRTYARAQEVPSTLAGGVRKTTYAYDKLGHLIEQRDLGATHLDGSTRAQWVRQSHDAWGNTLAATSSSGFTTYYRYNTLNQVVEEKLPSTTYLSDHDTRGDSDERNDQPGSTITASPTRRHYLDAWGRSVGDTDARGHTSTATYTQTGELETEYHADGGTVQHVYDAFGRETTRYNASWFAGDANSRLYTYRYDRLDRKVAEAVYGRWLSHANGADDSPGSFTWVWNTYSLGSYQYDALGHRISETTGAADKTADLTVRYHFDSAGRLVKTVTPLTTLQYFHNAAGQTVREVDALGQSTRFSYNAQGRLLSKLDIGGASTQFSYDRSGALRTQSNDRGQNLAYTYYDDGRLQTVRDLWADSQSTYDYDADGHKTVDRFVTGASSAQPLKYRDVAMGYDELGRLRTVTDTAGGTGLLADYALTIQYDANGNRARVQGSTSDDDLMARQDGKADPYLIDADGLARRQVEQLFSYDVMDRQTGLRQLSYSQLDETTEVRQWRFFSYDKDGNRIAEEQRFANQGGVGALSGRVVKYSYDFAGRVAEANVLSKTLNAAGQDVLGLERQHRKTLYLPWGGTGSTQEWQWAKTVPVDSLAYADQAPDRVITTETRYNAEQAIVQVVGRQKIGSGAWYLSSNQTHTLDAAGNRIAMHVDGYQTQSTSLASRLDYAYSYLKMDSYLQRTVRVSGTQWNGAQLLAVTPVTTTQDYDVNGRLQQVRDDNDASGSAEQFLVTDNAGHIVMKVQNRSATAMTAHRATGTYDPATATHGSAGGGSVAAQPVVPNLQASLAGNVISRVSVQRMRYANEQVIGTTEEVRSLAKMTIYDGPDKFPVYLDTFSTSMRTEDALSAAEVNVSASGALQYTWNSGDSLRGLAQTFYGDAKLWYVIAEANGYVDDSEIAEGTLLSLPTVTRSSNTANTLKVYDAGRIVGDTHPEPIAPPPPPPPHGGGCGGLGTLIVIVVAVVATVITAGAAAGYLGAASTAAGATGTAAIGGAALSGGGLVAGAGGFALGSSAATMVASAAIGGAMGAMASQGLAMALGMQEHFSWKQVGQGAIGAGVTAGVGQVGLFSELGQYGAAAASAATGNAITQGLAVATDMQEHFNWRAVTTSAMAAPVAGYLRGQAGGAVKGLMGGNSGQVAAEFAQRFTAGVVSQRIRMAVYNQGKLDYASIAADAFGNVLGQGLANAMGPSSEAGQQANNRSLLNGIERQADPSSYVTPESGAGLRVGSGGPGLWVSQTRLDAWQDQVDAGIQDRARALVKFEGVAAQVWAAEDTVSARSALVAQHAQADAYRRELAVRAQDAHEAQLHVYIEAMQRSAGPRGGAGAGYSSAVAAQLMEVPQYDAAGSLTGTTTSVEAGPSSSYADQMAHLGQFGIGALKSLPNLPSTMANGLVDLAKLSANGYARTLNAVGAVSDDSLNIFLESPSVQVPLALTASNREQALGQIFGDVGWGMVVPGAVTRAVDYGGDLFGAARMSASAAEGWAAAQAERAALLRGSNAGVGNAGNGKVGFVDLSAPGDIAPGFYRANPAQLRFTQSDASPFFSKGGTIDSLVTDLRSGRVTADQVGNPLQVVMHDSLPFSIDNRRLVAFNLAGVKDVPIQIVSLENPAVAARFFDRFDPIGGVGNNIVITPSSGRTASQMLLRDSGLIQGVQLGR